MKIPKSQKSNTVMQRRVKLADPVAETPLAKRMLGAMGTEDFQMVRTFQQVFGAKMVHYQDGHGEVGKRPRWVDEPV